MFTAQDLSTRSREERAWEVEGRKGREETKEDEREGETKVSRNNGGRRLEAEREGEAKVSR